MSRFTARLLERRRAGYVPVIPDFKLVSPADGPLFAGRDVLQEARDMEAAGAPALSVVTEERNFSASIRNRSMRKKPHGMRRKRLTLQKKPSLSSRNRIRFSSTEAVPFLNLPRCWSVSMT